MRSASLTAFGVLLLLGVATACDAPQAPGAQPPHGVVLITLDTARGDHFDWNDATRLPAIKQAFADGMRFTEAVAVAPVTGPSHASILTGLAPIEHRLLSNPLPLRPDVDTLAEQLQRAGYRTAAFVSTSLLAKGRGFDQGFDHYDSEVDSAYVEQFYQRSAWHTTDRALAWLRKNDTESFHLWIHYFDAHAPYDPPGPHRPRGFEDLERAPQERPTIEHLQELHAIGAVDPRIRGWYRALYAGELSAIDVELARLFAFFDARPYAESVAIVLTADHGEELADHDSYFEHGRSLHDGVMRVPLALRAPGISAELVHQQVSHAAIAATLLEIAGQSVAPELEPSLLQAGASRGRSQVMIKEPHPFVRPWGAALRAPPWKYLYREDGRESLYDLSQDPAEATNIAEREPQRVAEMRARIEMEILPSLGSRESPLLDAQTREMLHALGYADLPDSR